MDAARDRETWTRKVEAVLTRRIHLCHLQMYTRTHTSICKALIPPPALPEPLLHEGKKINSKTKGSHWPAHKEQEQKYWPIRRNRISVLREQILQVFFRLVLHLCSLEESGAAGKGKRSNLCLLRTPRGHSKAVSCPDCPGRCRMSWCPSQSRRRCPLVGTFPAIASGWLWDGSTDPGSQNDLSSPQKDPIRNTYIWRGTKGKEQNV